MLASGESARRSQARPDQPPSSVSLAVVETDGVVVDGGAGEEG
jgi:hypothetical protein